MAAAVPGDHPLAPAIVASVAEVRRNPFWKPEQKELFISRLVRSATG